MPPIRTCRPRPAPTPASTPLTGPEAALAVVLSVLATPARAETVALALDHAHRGLACVVVAGTHHADDVLEVAHLFEDVADREPQLGALVLATVRPGGGVGPSVDDERRWFDLRARFADRGVQLLDWFLVDGDLAGSVAELTDSHWAWQARPPEDLR